MPHGHSTVQMGIVAPVNRVKRRPEIVNTL
jgi:hypothetical protein